MGYSKNKMPINGKALKRKIEGSGLSLKDVEKETGVYSTNWSKAYANDEITPAYLKVLCMCYGWDEKEFTRMNVPNPSDRATDDAEKLLRTAESVNKTMFEVLFVLKSIRDSLTKLEGYAANINVSTAETKRAVIDLRKELKGE